MTGWEVFREIEEQMGRDLAEIQNPGEDAFVTNVVWLSQPVTLESGMGFW